MTPIGHLGIALPAAVVARVNLPIAGFCAILPDLVDKPLWAAGVGDGMYVGHSLTFALPTALAFLLWRRTYGLSALIGLGTHMLLDMAEGHRVPWLWPLDRDVNPLLRWGISVSDLRGELILVACAVAAAAIYVSLHRWFTGRRNQRAQSDRYGTEVRD